MVVEKARGELREIGEVAHTSVRQTSAENGSGLLTRELTNRWPASLSVDVR